MPAPTDLRATFKRQGYLRIARPPELVTEAEAEAVMRRFYLAAEHLGEPVEKVGESSVIWHPDTPESHRESYRKAWGEAPMN